MIFELSKKSSPNNMWQVFLTVAIFCGYNKTKNSVFKKSTKKNFKIYFEKVMNQIILKIILTVQICISLYFKMNLYFDFYIFLQKSPIYL